MSTHESACPHGICDGDGWIFQPNPHGADDAIRCRCLAERVERKRAGRALKAVPDKLQSVALDRRPLVELDDRSRRALKQYVKHFPDHFAVGKGLWFTGEPGVGKTCAAAWIALQIAPEGHTIGWHVVTDLLSLIKSTWADDAQESEWTLLQRLSEVDVLVLDDLAAERPTEWVIHTFFSILNRRMNDQRVTIVTTDLDRQQVIDKFGFRAVRRLDEMCGKPLELRRAEAGHLRQVGT